MIALLVAFATKKCGRSTNRDFRVVVDDPLQLDLHQIASNNTTLKAPLPSVDCIRLVIVCVVCCCCHYCRCCCYHLPQSSRGTDPRNLHQQRSQLQPQWLQRGRFVRAGRMNCRARHSVQAPNKGMEPTVKSVIPFARRRAKGLPLFPAAHSRR